jgi:hypothetical protein
MRPSRRRRFATVLAVALPLSLTPSPAFAAGRVQEQSVPPATSPTLDDALPKLAYDTARFGALLVVDPKGTKPPAGAAPLPDAPASGYKLNELAAAFGRKPVRVGTSLTVLAPTEMVVLNDRPGPPDPAAGLRGDEILCYLAASLTPAQWEKLGGAAGLGAADLTPEQRQMFDALVPNPLRVRRDPPAGSPAGTAPQTVTLTDAQRSQIRLRLGRAVSFLFTPGGTERALFVLDLPAPEKDGAPARWRALADRNAAFTPRPDAFGQALKRTVPEQPKPGDLDTSAAAFDAAVSLAALENGGPLTVGELAARAGKAAGAEVYADGRIAKLPIYARGDSARAGDVLAALARAVTGAYRRVGPAYVLADDVEGLGTRIARIAEWHEAARARRAEYEAALAGRAPVPEPSKYLNYAADDPVAAQPGMREKLGRSRASRGVYGAGPEVGIGELSPAAANAVREQVKKVQPDAAATISRVRLEARTRASWVLPDGMGEADAAGLSFDPLQPAADDLSDPGDAFAPPARPVALPAVPAKRALYVALTDAKEARKAVAAAKAKGLNQLWVAVTPGDPAGTAALAAAVAAGKGQGVAVVAVARLLSAPREGTSGEPDVNILGQDSPAYAASRKNVPSGPLLLVPVAPTDRTWLRPDGANRDALTARLSELARTPGLAGLALTDTAAPGYNTPEGEGAIRTTAVGNDFGYTPEARLAFLRAHGYDPVDLSAVTLVGVDLALPFYPDAGRPPRAPVGPYAAALPAAGSAEAALRDWNLARYQTGADLLAGVHAALRRAAPGLPLYLAARPSPVVSLGGTGWFGSWDRPDRLPYPKAGGPNPGERVTLVQSAHEFSKDALLALPYPDDPAAKPAGTVSDYARSLTALLGARGGPAGWDGLVLDLSRLPLERALSLLEGGVAPPATANGS